MDMNGCPVCGGGMPGEVPDGDVCRCGTVFGGPLIPGGDGEAWRMIRHMLAFRAGHCCEICGRVLGPSWGLRMDPEDEGTVHHRQPAGAGGTSSPTRNDLARLLLACGGRLGGVRGCHGTVEREREWALGRGLLVPLAVPGKPVAATDPAQVPVTLFSGRRVLLCSYAPIYLAAPGAPYAVA